MRAHTNTPPVSISLHRLSRPAVFSRHQFSRILIRIKNIKWKLNCEGPAEMLPQSLKCAEIRLQTTALNTSADRRTWLPPVGLGHERQQSCHDPFRWCLCRQRCVPHWHPCWFVRCLAKAWMQRLASAVGQREWSWPGRCLYEKIDGLCHQS